MKPAQTPTNPLDIQPSSEVEVITRWIKGEEPEYSVDGGETWHPKDDFHPSVATQLPTPTTPPQTELSELLKKIRETSFSTTGLFSFVMSDDEATHQIQLLFTDRMLGLIGEDEVRPPSGPKRNGIDQGLRRARNKLRAELRRKL